MSTCTIAAPGAGKSTSTPPAKGVARVLHVINGEHYAGAERVQDLLAGRLGDLGFEVGLACLKPGQFAESRANRDVPLYEVPMRGRFDLRAVASLVRLIRRHGYGLLHAHTPRSLLIAGPASVLTGVPLVYHVHSPAARDTTHRGRNWINALVERIGISMASAVIPVSGSLAEHVKEHGLDAEKVTVVRNGVPCRRPRPDRDPGQSDWTLGIVALFRPRKGFEVLLDALALLRSEGLRVRLRAVGGFETPQYECRIKDKVERLGLGDAIDWTGFTQDVDAELRRMDVLVLPSLFGEGLPMVILEAMAAGVPVVATRVEGVPEAIREGIDGLIAEPSSPESLAAAVAQLIRGKQDWSQLRAGALARHAESFSDRAMAEGVAAVYRRAIGEVEEREAAVTDDCLGPGATNSS
jgi:glycosyltransferase involved in cell wall biosynthesis